MTSYLPGVSMYVNADLFTTLWLPHIFGGVHNKSISRSYLDIDQDPYQDAVFLTKCYEDTGTILQRRTWIDPR